MFRKPWEFSNRAIRVFTRMSKVEFFEFVQSSIGSRDRAGTLNLWSECLMFLMKVCQNVPYEMLGSLFEVDSTTAHFAVYRQLMFHYLHNVNIPQIIREDGSVNEEELEKLFETAHRNTEDFYKAFDFEDPNLLDRIGVLINCDATYLFTEGSSDIELQKSVWYTPKNTHVVKWITFTDMSGKIIGICPASTSQTPASGDGHIISRYIQLEDSSDTGKYIRTLLRGTSRYFPVLIVDAGFVAEVPNAPREVRNIPNLVDVCEELGAVLLHTSNRHHTYHLRENARGKLEKVVPRNEERPTLDEATVKLTRLLRKPQEMSFGCEKKMYKLLGAKLIPNSLIQPLSASYRRKLKIPERFANVPKITFFATVICSLYNLVHTGFKLLYFQTAEQQIQAAGSFKKRMQADNPFLHDGVFDINFDTSVRGPWTDHTFADFSPNNPQNPCNIPRLTLDEVNPKAVGLCSGPHALSRAFSVLTYVSQLHVKDNNITGPEADNIVQNFPSFHKVRTLRLETRPENWNDDVFGSFQPGTFVKSVMPPSNRSVSTRANFHTCVIFFGDQGSERLGLIPPMDRILYYFCHSCPALNALCSMDRHLGALIMGLCFQELFKSTAKKSRLMNPVALDANQCLIALPMMNQSRDIPQHVERRSRDTRQSDTNPLYVSGVLPQQRSRSLGTPARGSTGPQPRGSGRAITPSTRGGSTTTRGVSPAGRGSRGSSRGRSGSGTRGSRGSSVRGGPVRSGNTQNRTGNLNG